MALTYTETEVVSETERYIVNPDIPVWALLPAYIFLKQGITGVAYPSYFDQLAFIGSSGLAIISHPAFHLAFPGLSPFKKFQPSSDIDPISRSISDVGLKNFNLHPILICLSDLVTKPILTPTWRLIPLASYIVSPLPKPLSPTPTVGLPKPPCPTIPP